MKDLLNLGKLLTKGEQKKVFGGNKDLDYGLDPICDPQVVENITCNLDGNNGECPPNSKCTPFGYILTGICACIN